MPKTWKLKRTEQCALCPWKKSTDPRKIPRGYSEEKHRALESTIADDPAASIFKPTKSMACHAAHDEFCIGWLVNQVGPGNNIGLRIHVRNCENFREIKLTGEQHETFKDTLPK